MSMQRHCGAEVMLTRRLIANDKGNLLTSSNGAPKSASRVCKKAS
jgi:hypothetical protein